MEFNMLSFKGWIENQWPSKIFFDPRVHKRVLLVAEAFLNFPDRSIPKRFQSAGATKGCYRLLSRTDMGHEKLQSAHYENVLEEAASANGRVLFIQDGSELIYNSHPWTTGLGHTADASGNGIMFHSCLAVKIEEGLPRVIGLACQKAWIRTDEKTEKSEGDVWAEMIHRIGPPPKKHSWVTVGDRGSDIFSFVGDADSSGWDCVVRSKHDRKIRVNGIVTKLKKHMRSLPAMASFNHKLRSKAGGASGQEVTLYVSWTEAEMMPPDTEVDKKPIKGSYVRVWCNEDPDIEWILFTLTAITSKESAFEIVTIYTHRWIIEEYHKCLKTGCKMEEAQLRAADHLMNLFGILGIIATQLLQLRDLGRTRGSEPATAHVDKISVKLIEKIYKLSTPPTVKEFWRRVAMLGGFLGRKSDGNPGWQTIWYGWLRLQDMCRGAALAGSC
jgi:hypothetical protein